MVILKIIIFRIVHVTCLTYPKSDERCECNSLLYNNMYSVRPYTNLRPSARKVDPLTAVCDYIRRLRNKPWYGNNERRLRIHYKNTFAPHYTGSMQYRIITNIMHTQHALNINNMLCSLNGALVLIAWYGAATERRWLIGSFEKYNRYKLWIILRDVHCGIKSNARKSLIVCALCDCQSQKSGNIPTTYGFSLTPRRLTCFIRVSLRSNADLSLNISLWTGIDFDRTSAHQWIEYYRCSYSSVIR